MALLASPHAFSQNSKHSSKHSSPYEELEFKEAQTDIVVLRQVAETKIADFSAILKRTLMSAIQQQGLEHAVAVCKDQAPKIAEKLSKDGWTIARTSLKTRNAYNAPDEWEQTQLIAFNTLMNAGEPPATLNVSDLSQGRFRYMKAIPTGQVCLACHGSQVDPALLQSIQAYYPNDRAIGFTLKDLRGAFSLTKAIKK